MTWTLFGIANIAVYIYTEKYLAANGHWFSRHGGSGFHHRRHGDTTPKPTEVLIGPYPSPNNLNVLNGLLGINSGFEHTEGNDLNVWRTIATT